MLPITRIIFLMLFLAISCISFRMLVRFQLCKVMDLFLLQFYSIKIMGTVSIDLISFYREQVEGLNTYISITPIISPILCYRGIGHHEPCSSNPYNSGRWGLWSCCPYNGRQWGLLPLITIIGAYSPIPTVSVCSSSLGSQCPYNSYLWEQPPLTPIIGAAGARSPIDEHYRGTYYLE